MSVSSFIQQLIEDNYALGEIIAVKPIKAGDTNKSFFVITQTEEELKKWYVRQYNAAEQEQDIIYEHAFEHYYSKNVNGAMQTMLPVETVSGKTWLTAEYEGQKNYYAVFNTIRGLEPYSWEYNTMPQEALDFCARICAQFQSWAYGFVGPAGSGRREPSLLEQMELWKKDIPAAEAEKNKNPKVFRRFTEYFDNEIPFLMEMIDFCREELGNHAETLKKCICHKDLNPGNVMFNEKNEITAVFDLDWVNTDYRLYDIAWMGYQAMASWKTDSWGDVPVEKIGRFLQIYNQTIREMDSELGELTQEEKDFFPVMMIIGAIKVIADFTAYEDHTDEVHRMFVNTWRFMDSVHFMKDHLEEIRAAAR